MNVRQQKKVRLFFVLFATIFGNAESNGAVRSVEWFGGAFQEEANATSTPLNPIGSVKPRDSAETLGSVGLVEPIGIGGSDLDSSVAAVAENATGSTQPLYAEGEDEALNAFQRGMVNVQEFAASTLTLASESGRRATSSGLIAEAEWLNWRVSSTNTLYSTSYSSSGNFISGERFALESKGNGVRARLGKRFEDCWDLTFCYTYFEGNDSGTQTDGTQYVGSSLSLSTATLLPTLAATQTGALQTISVTGDVASRLSVFDLEFGRWICPNSATSLEFRPFGGLRAAKTFEKYGGLYVNNAAITTVEQSTKGTGYGIRGGAEAKWNVAGGWSVFGSGATSVLANSIVNKTYQKFSYQGLSDEYLDYNAHSRVATPVLEVEAGVSWRKGGWEVKGGYELSNWFNVSNLDAPGGDLLFYGYFAGASWNF